MVNGEIVAKRWRNADGTLELEVGIQDGRQHGYLLEWTAGVLTHAEPYRRGMMHGIANQWSLDGELKLAHKMRNGTSIDLWSVPLSEERRFKSGYLHGFERWWNVDEKTVYSEQHWRESKRHGISREWNMEGRLRRGFPQYYVDGEKPNKRAYLKALLSDRTLPEWRSRHNDPHRSLPAEYVTQMKERWGPRWRRVEKRKL